MLTEVGDDKSMQLSTDRIQSIAADEPGIDGPTVGICMKDPRPPPSRYRSLG